MSDEGRRITSTRLFHLLADEGHDYDAVADAIEDELDQPDACLDEQTVLRIRERLTGDLR